MTFDELCKRLAVCAHCLGVEVNYHCIACHGTGLDPAKVEMLRGFERETLGRAAAECLRLRDEYHAQEMFLSGEATRVCAAAIEAMGAAKPAGG